MGLNSMEFQTKTGTISDDIFELEAGFHVIEARFGTDTLVLDLDSTDVNFVFSSTDRVTIQHPTGITLTRSVEFFQFRDVTLPVITGRISSPEDLTGGAGADLLLGNATLEDSILGLGGDDFIYGYRGEDFLDGGTGNDRIFGANDSDTLRGGDGADLLDGGSGNDELTGDDGNDTLRGGKGEDTLTSGTGNDQLFGQRNADLITGGAGNDRLNGGGGNDTLKAGIGNDFLKGGVRDDVLNGGDGDDRLIANGGDDRLNGGDGIDILNAGGGTDTLNGGAGDDILRGGAQSDVFVFTDGHGNDVVQDFDAFDDAEVIDFTGLSGISSFGDVAAVSSQQGADVVIDTGSGEIIVTDVVLDDLDAGDFLF